MQGELFHANQYLTDSGNVARAAFPLLTANVIGATAPVSAARWNLAEALPQKLREGDEYRAAQGVFWFHVYSGEPDQAADWLEKIVEQGKNA